MAAEVTTPRQRRTSEEIEAARAEKAQRQAARKAKLQKLADYCRDMAASFERRAAGRKPSQGTQSASMRKALRKVIRATSEAEKRAEADMARITEQGGEPRDRGTGLTRLKLTGTPLSKLIDEHKIGSEEMQAADEIEAAFTALASRLMVRGISLDRVDCGRGGFDSGRAAKAVANYTRWAKHWTDRANAYGDSTLEITIAVTIDQKSVRVVAAELGFDHRKIEAATINGLRDYAARAGFVSGGMAAGWMSKAEALFAPPSVKLFEAVRRARIET